MADLSRNHTLHWCRSCLGHFDTEEVLNTHKRYCRGVDTSGQVLLLPDENRKLKFENEPYVSPGLSSILISSLRVILNLYEYPTRLKFVYL